MNYLALATDYDGTVAHDGRVDDQTLAALKRFKESGRRLILVSGREFEDLMGVFPDPALFDRMVLENGALLHDPGTGVSRAVAPAPPPEFLEDLRRRGVPFSVGRSIVATVEPHEHAVLAAIRDLGLEWHVIFNKGAVMVLPSGVNKATGLAPALEELGVPAERTIGVGDAENDHAFLGMCGFSVAVGNALQSVKEAADWSIWAPRGLGVQELISQVLADDLASRQPRRSRREPAM